MTEVPLNAAERVRFQEFMSLRGNAVVIARALHGRNGVIFTHCSKKQMATAYAKQHRHMRREITISDAVFVSLVEKFGQKE